MKRLYAFLIAASLCLPSFGAMAWWQSIQQVAVASAVIPLSLDGTPQTNNNAGATSFALPMFSTSNSNDVVIVAMTGNGFPLLAPTSANLTFSHHPGLTDPSGGSSQCSIWYAIAASPLVNEVITVHQTSAAFFTGLVFAVTGGKTSAPFDVSGPSMSSTATLAAITTAASNTFAFGLLINGGPSPINSFTNMNATAAGNFVVLNYKIVSAPLSGVNWDSSGAAGSIGTAIVQGP